MGVQLGVDCPSIRTRTPLILFSINGGIIYTQMLLLKSTSRLLYYVSSRGLADRVGGSDDTSFRRRVVSMPDEVIRALVCRFVMLSSRNSNNESRKSGRKQLRTLSVELSA